MFDKYMNIMCLLTSPLLIVIPGFFLWKVKYSQRYRTRVDKEEYVFVGIVSLLGTAFVVIFAGVVIPLIIFCVLPILLMVYGLNKLPENIKKFLNGE